jgi:prepilin-type N-terminal cleavage/methylation domain-containing protein
MPGNLRLKEAFSLIELMVVVAIVGILSSLAIPKYLKFRARARQVEIKSAVTSMFVALKSFHADQASYTTCIVQAGYVVSGKNYYMQGFWGLSANLCGDNGTSSCYIYNYVTGAPCDGSPPPPGVYHSDCTYFAQAHSGGHLISWGDPDPVIQALVWQPTTSTFTVGGAGYISNTGIADIWTIDDKKIVRQLSDGL